MRLRQTVLMSVACWFYIESYKQKLMQRYSKIQFCSQDLLQLFYIMRFFHKVLKFYLLPSVQSSLPAA